MPSEMMLLSGVVDKDTAPDMVQRGLVIDALNTELISTASLSKVRTTSPGNRPFPLGTYSVPRGTNMVIGSFADNIKNRIIDFLYNDSGFSQIRIWDFTTKTIKVLVNESSAQFGNSKVLNFNKDVKITSCFVIYRDSVAGDLLFYTANDGNPPREINIDKTLAASGYYALLSYEDLCYIKRPPLSAPSVNYMSDTTVQSNNLRSKLFQFAYRFIYDDFSPSTYSPWSKVPFPFGSTDPSTDPVVTNNNMINIVLGQAYNLVYQIEIVMRIGVGDDKWTNPVLINTIQASGQGTTYAFNFYNDGVYSPVDLRQITLPYTYLPDQAGCMDLVNGNSIVAADITEGRNYTDINLNVQMSAYLDTPVSAGSIGSIPLNNNDFTVTWAYWGNNGVNYTVTYNGTSAIIGTATVTIFAYVRVHTFLNSSEPKTAVIGGFNLTASTTSVTIGKEWGSQVDAGSAFASINSVSGTRQLMTEKFVSLPKYDWFCKYAYSLVYFDKDGKTNTAYNNASMNLEMPPYQVTINNGVQTVQPPAVNASINHRPPSWAVSYSWARTLNLTESFVLYWHAMTVKTDDKFIYLDVSNIAYNFQSVNPSTNFAYSFATGDRMRMLYYNNTGTLIGMGYSSKEYVIVGLIDNPPAGKQNYVTGFQIINPGDGYSSPPNIQFYINNSLITNISAHAVMNGGQLSDIVLDTPNVSLSSAPEIRITGGGGQNASAAAIYGYFQGTFVKLYLDADTYPNADVLIKIYRPATVPAANNLVFFEFGEQYPIIVDNTGTAYHAGMLQNQTALQPATFKFTEGDVFLTNIEEPSSVTETPTPFYSDLMMAQNYDDNFKSNQNSNGRAWGVFTTARRTEYPTLIRFSQSYVQDTLQNLLSIWYGADQDEYNKAYGAVRRVHARQNFLHIFQQLKVGRVPVFQEIMQTASGSNVLTQSDRLLNNIQYLIGDFGIGDAPASLAHQFYADYFADTSKGVICRVSQDGVDAISKLYNWNSYYSPVLPMYGSNILSGTSPNPATPNAPLPFVLGYFDVFTNKYMVTMTPVDRWQNGAQLLSFAGNTSGFMEGAGYVGSYSYVPEWACVLNNTLCTFVNSLLYTHDSPAQCNFYGTQYDAYVQTLMNEALPNDKSYLTVKEYSNAVWYADLIQTNLGQQSNIPSAAFKYMEGNAISSFFRDINSSGGLVNGTPLKGKWMELRLRVTPALTPLYITAISLKYNIYP